MEAGKYQCFSSLEFTFLGFDQLFLSIGKRCRYAGLFKLYAFGGKRHQAFFKGKKRDRRPDQILAVRVVRHRYPGTPLADEYNASVSHRCLMCARKQQSPEPARGF